MTTWAIVPVKPFSEGKSRLDGVLTGVERYQLNECCLKNTLNVLSNVPMVDKTIVISRDDDALEIARTMGASAQKEESKNGLNKALYQVNNTLDKYRDRVLVIPTDLPLLSVEDLSRVIELGSQPPVVVVVPDRRDNGTNALLVYPAGCIRYRFGSHSSTKHAYEAKKRGINTIIVNIPGIGLDLDLVEDLELIKSMDHPLPIQAYKSMEETVI